MRVVGFGQVLAVAMVLALGVTACTDFEKEAKATAAAKAAAADGGGSLGDGAGAGKTDTVVGDVSADVEPGVPPACTPTQCDDKNACTDEVCADGKCSNTPNVASCDDGNACTEGDKCTAGKCTAGTAKPCDDKNACTDDSCEPTKGCVGSPNTASCDDGSKCTDKDACKDGKCSGAVVQCPADTTCTTYACAADKGCEALPKTATCTDDDECTVGDACKAGSCAAGTTKDCKDTNPCTDDDKCDKVKGCLNLANSATCTDNNACTIDTYCADKVCPPMPIKSCDDGNPCTKEDCDPVKGCQVTALDTGNCDDGNACTAGDQCKAGKCAPGGTFTCDDKILCTDDACHPAKGCVATANEKACTDDDACTESDKCADGLCKSGLAKICDDKNPCTEDSCDKVKGCQNVNNTAKCSDSNQCTVDDVCDGAGKCAGKALACDDGNPCTDDSCDAAKGCVSSPNSKTCEDGNQCTAGDACAQAKCTAGKAVVCDDKNACTDDTCSPTKGCQYANSTAPCDDDSLCTLDDSCSGGKCSPGAPKLCNDNKVCTDDGCDPKSGCTTSLNTASCDDGNPCTLGDSCKGGTCAGSTSSTIDDFDGKTTFGNNALGKPWINDGTYNNDSGYKWSLASGAATTSWTGNSNAQPLLHSMVGHRKTFNFLVKYKATASGCAGSSGVFNIVVNANANGKGGLAAFLACAGSAGFGQVGVAQTDGSIVKADAGLAADTWYRARLRYDGTKLRLKVWADGAAEPINDLVSAEATDTAASSDQLALGGDLGSGQTATVTVDSVIDDSGLSCSDGNPCTTDSCDKAKGCTYAAVSDGSQCDDGNGCTTADKCAAGKCAGVGKSCDDNNACTTDSCANNVCSYANSSAPCDDGNACTTGDNCDGAGACKTKGTLACDDSNPCTDDSCDKTSGCKASANTASCNDNDPCTTNDVCAGNACKGGPPLTCNDNNPCTTDTCTGSCKFTAGNDGASCNDSSACTDSDKCNAGKCVGATKVCYDANPCTTDSCDPASGCKFADDDALKCSDNDICTTGDKCAAGKCVTTGTLNCDDGNVCTDDKCGSPGGCSNLANAADCNDQNLCTPGDKCVAKACKAGAAKVCDDGNKCTIDKCDTVDGQCKTTAAPQTGDEGAAANGVDDDCDTLVDEEFDLDHDGVYCKTAVCQAVTDVDNCPTVWSPDNAKEPCAGLGSGWTASKDVVLTEPGLADGQSGQRRTHEVVEVPVSNGALDGTLLALWRMDGGGGTDAGPFKNDATMGAVGKVAGAWGDADGAVTAAAGPIAQKNLGVLAPVGAGAVTLMAWVKPAAYSGSYHVVAGLGPAKIFMLYVAGNNAGVWTYTSSDVFKVGTGSALPLNAWSHMAATYQSGQLSFYLNGKLVGSATGNVVAADTTLAVGSWPSGGDKLDGAVDEVAMFSRALSATEVAAYVQSGKPYATAFVTGTQPDLDDIRATETTPYQTEHLVPHEVIGVAPHSDSDLKDVIGYWKFNGDGKDVTINQLDATGTGTAPTLGRFGDTGGALKLSSAQFLVPATKAQGKLYTAQGSWEAWVRVATLTGNHQYIAYLGSSQFRYLLLRDDGHWQFSQQDANVQIAAWDPAVAVVGKWTHLGATWDGSKASLYVDGVLVHSVTDSKAIAVQNQGMTFGNSIGFGNPLAGGEIDEFIAHSVVKPADYFYKRAHPGIPTVRFLASTKAFATNGKYEFYKYAIKSGNGAAVALPPIIKALDKTTTCNALLSPCLGYQGWWRFDEGSGVTAADMTTWQRHAKLSLPAWVASPNGTAFDSQAATAIVPDFPNWTAKHALTIDAVGRPHATVNLATMAGSFVSNDAGGAYNLTFSVPNAKPRLGSEQIGPFLIQAGTAAWTSPVFQAVAVSTTLSPLKGALFANGVLLPSSWPSSTTSGGGGSSPLGLGGRTKTNDDQFPGAVDQIRIMTRVLEGDELLHHPLATWKLK